MKKKIAIVGTTSSLVDAPYNDPEWEIWGLNGAYAAMPRYDRWFDMHSIEVLKKYHQSDYFTFLNKVPNLMMAHVSAEVPNAQQFPAMELVGKYGRYFTNTVSWLIAYAIEELMKQEPDDRKPTIGLWGINMAMDTEYSIQRPSCEYFLGVAEGKGIDVIIPDSSELMKCSFLYGIEEVPAFVKKMPDKKRELTNNYNEVLQEEDEVMAFMGSIQGYMQAMTDAINLAETEQPKAVKFLQNLHMDKTDFYKPKLLESERHLKELALRKSYINGALDLHSYNYKNFGY